MSNLNNWIKYCLSIVLVLMLNTNTFSQDLSKGPFERLVIRNATVIDGTGSPAYGPVDIVIKNNRIVDIVEVGGVFGNIDEELKVAKGDYEIDASDMYVMPGFIDAHVHIRKGDKDNKADLPAKYFYYLNLAHGVTSVLEAGSGNGLKWTVNEKRKSEQNRIIAPRIFPFFRPRWTLNMDRQKLTTEKQTREWVREVADNGADGLKLSSHPPKIMKILIDEAHKQDLLTTAHLRQGGINGGVTRMNILDAARLGLDSQQHWYGLAESMLKESSIPDWSAGYNQNNEQDRFAQAGRFFQQAAEVGSERWNSVMEELLALDLIITPTMSIYEDSRDIKRSRNLPWINDFASQGMLNSWEPGAGHGSFYSNWTTKNEADWYSFFDKWQKFLKEYNDKGGVVAAGSDAGTFYALMGFGYIRELELLQHAGLKPLEVVRAATMNAAKVIGESENLGTIEMGKLADLVIIDENPLENFKVLYGTGFRIHDPKTGVKKTIGKINYTIKDGIIYDAEVLLEEVKKMVENTK